MAGDSECRQLPNGPRAVPLDQPNRGAPRFGCQRPDCWRFVRRCLLLACAAASLLLASQAGRAEAVHQTRMVGVLLVACLLLVTSGIALHSLQSRVDPSASSGRVSLWVRRMSPLALLLVLLSAAFWAGRRSMQSVERAPGLVRVAEQETWPARQRVEATRLPQSDAVEFSRPHGSVEEGMKADELDSARRIRRYWDPNAL